MPEIVTIDIGSSSVRALVFDSDFRQLEGLRHQEKYEAVTSAGGGVEIDAQLLVDLTVRCLDAIHQQILNGHLRPAAVGISTFWHCFVGVDLDGQPTAPIIHLFDTRSKDKSELLRSEIDPDWLHATTGCMPHTSYWPAKLLWLRDTRPEAFKRTARWLSIGEYVLLKLAGKPAESVSMVSASGIWDVNRNDYCAEVLSFIGINGAQLSPVENLDEPCTKLLPQFAARWPELDGIPWYPAFGDGACNSIGSGCTTVQKFALMVGTSGALRAVTKRDKVEIPTGLWCYRVNRERFILGGAISNGGGVFHWANSVFKLPPDAEDQIAKREPGIHGVTSLPFLAGERSPYWRPDLRAMIVGLSLSTTAVDILQALLEGVSLRFKQIYRLLTQNFGEPREIIASGGALTHSKAWPQLLSESLGHTLQQCLEPEASSRGAAILVADRLGLIPDLDEVRVTLGEPLNPDPKRARAFERLLARDASLFDLFYGASIEEAAFTAVDLHQE